MNGETCAAHCVVRRVVHEALVVEWSEDRGATWLAAGREYTARSELTVRVLVVRHRSGRPIIGGFTALKRRPRFEPST